MDILASENGQGKYFLGERQCPNHECNAHVFVVCDMQWKVVRSYPVQRVDFNTKGIPPAIQKSFNEALTCFAEDLHVAAAIMIRRTLEELCEDKGASGNDLKERIKALRSSIVIPEKLFDALDELRLMGNDAAHIKAKTFDEIGHDEVEVAVELTKEVLKAVYQYDNLVSKLLALKKTPPSTAPASA